MKLSEIFEKAEKPVFSFEFFLPKTEESRASFKETVSRLKKLSPGFVSLTYGAMGSQRENTLETAGMLRNEYGLETAAHLTGIAHTRSEIDAILDKIKALGIENIVALRGDLPQDGSGLPADKRDFPFAEDLVARIQARGGFDMAVAGYPEVHPEAPSPEKDLEFLKAKVDAGASVVITQLFFENSDFFAFCEKAREAGIDVPIVPGIMPVSNIKQLDRFAGKIGASIPEDLRSGLEAVQDDPKAVAEFGIEYATRQCRELLLDGVPGIHFYTLNKSRSVERIVEGLSGV